MTEDAYKQVARYWFNLGWNGCKIYKGKDKNEAFELALSAMKAFSEEQSND